MIRALLIAIRHFIGMAIVFSAFVLFPAQQARAENAAVDSFEFNIEILPISFQNYPRLRVTSSDGVRWDTVEEESVDVRIFGRIDFTRQNRGYAEQVGLFQGACEQTNCGNNNLLWYLVGGHRGWSFDKTLSLPSSVLTEQGDSALRNAISACNVGDNNDLSVGKVSAIQSRLSLSINTRSATVAPIVSSEPDVEGVTYNGGDHSKTAPILMPVICEPFTQGVSVPTGELSTPRAQQLSVRDIRLSLTTFQSETTRPTPGRQCKRAKLRITAETNMPGPFPVILYSQIGALAINSRQLNLISKHKNGRFLATYEQWIETTRTQSVQFSAREISDNVFAQETPWKSVALRCEGTGGGGFQLAPN